MKKECFFSIRAKFTLGIIIICLLIGSLAIFSVNRIATGIIDREYSDRAEQISRAMANTIDPDDLFELRNAVYDIYTGVDEVVTSTEWGSDAWNAYMANYDSIREMPVFHKLQDHFRVYQDIFGVDCIYVTYYRTSLSHAIYIVDGAYGEDECPPGCVDSFEDGIWPDEQDPIVPATITNEDVYGWLVTAAYPVMRDGELVAHVCVDISMNDIRAKERSYVIITALSMLALTVIMLIVVLLYVGRNVIRPVVALSDTARNYCAENNDVVHHAFEKLQFTTHDEIGQLLSSMQQMETDMNTNINALIDTQVALRETEKKASTMEALAVKDSLTGVRNKTAYDHEVHELERDLADGFWEFGLAMVDLNFLKKTNDTYGHEKGNISIRRLCMLVCEVFEHSAVFRIGGDEFVVILKNRDYRNVDHLIADFNDRLEQLQNDSTLQPWERISAAIGYAACDKSVDKSVDDVFKKADKAMYERKVAMKAQRKD
ncbi:MAG: GGDEF domain-containing protein [Lachnospiraceae bacterium]|nr:GGDEF domain-containing protein [Lachnospiraceae bacterium]